MVVGDWKDVFTGFLKAKPLYIIIGGSLQILQLLQQWMLEMIAFLIKCYSCICFVHTANNTLVEACHPFYSSGLDQTSGVVWRREWRQCDNSTPFHSCTSPVSVRHMLLLFMSALLQLMFTIRNTVQDCCVHVQNDWKILLSLQWAICPLYISNWLFKIFHQTYKIGLCLSTKESTLLRFKLIWICLQFTSLVQLCVFCEGNNKVVQSRSAWYLIFYRLDRLQSCMSNRKQEFVICK